MKRTRLKVAAVATAALLIALVVANPAFAGEEGDKANSWRYENGQRIEQASEEQAQTSMRRARALASQASKTTKKLSYCWEKSFGTTKMYDVESGNGETTVSGAREVCIDVSEHNASIDWNAVAADDITSAIIRCGYGSNYSSQDDKYWLANVKGAQAAGIKIGVYLYSYATKATGTAPSAASEGQHVLRCLKEAGLTPNDLSLPIYYDLEEYSQENLSGETLEAMCVQFAKPLETAGYRVGIYASSSWFENKLNSVSFEAHNWSKWIPHYNNHCMFCTRDDGVPEPISNYGKYLDIWQFGSVGKVSGIGTDVDMNFIFNDISVKRTQKLSTYKITYKLNKGKMPSSYAKSYTTASSFDLPIPGRKGYAFAGWYTKSSLKGSAVSAISRGTKGNKTFYAKWMKGACNAKVTASSLNIRKSASTNSRVTGSLSKGTVICISKFNKKKTWGYIPKRGWVKLQYASLTSYYVKVTASKITVRKGAGTKYGASSTLKKGAKVWVYEKKGSWGHVVGKGWVKLKYTKRA